MPRSGLRHPAEPSKSPRQVTKMGHLVGLVQQTSRGSFNDHLIESIQVGTIEEIDDENDDED
jgi:hypothetical protein